MHRRATTSAIIVAAGASRRMGFDKLFAPLHGKHVLVHSIAPFQQCESIGEIVLVVREDRIDTVRKIVDAEKLTKVGRIIPGAEERHLSVWNGLQQVEAGTRFVAIHDGARPLTTPELIEQCIALAREHGAACCAARVHDTVKRACPDNKVAGSVEREGLWAMQTPQIFATDVVVQAYAALLQSGEACTDEVSAVQRIGMKIALLSNDDWNFKITVPQDLELAEQVLRLREEKRRGK
jgi:2-C-methyl-D-erythritol 4-phosphate cytidylyltransferase